MSEKTLQELEALKERLHHDITRSRNIDANGLSRNSPLLKNFEQVQRDIAKLQESK